MTEDEEENEADKLEKEALDYSQGNLIILFIAGSLLGGIFIFVFLQRHWILPYYFP